jgi:hypothetical protein
MLRHNLDGMHELFPLPSAVIRILNVLKLNKKTQQPNVNALQNIITKIPLDTLTRRRLCSVVTESGTKWAEILQVEKKMRAYTPLTVTVERVLTGTHKAVRVELSTTMNE